MTDKYVAPEDQREAFHCAHCGVYAHQTWASLRDGKHSVYRVYCGHCGDTSLWVDQKMVYPGTLIGQAPSDDMPEVVQEIYNEARAVAKASTRAAAALLRLAVETLVNELRPGPEKLNTKIGQMVKDGLGVEVQRMLDSVRVIGNDTLHRGEIDLEERSETVPMLMFCVNRIVERMITDPRQIEDLYQLLPQDKLDGIQNRDKKPGSNLPPVPPSPHRLS